jgi:5-methylcytosine-specific restriction endonuclease McrA
LKKKTWFLQAKHRGICQSCQTQTDPSELTLDHIVPLSRGGQNTRGNLRVVCRSCNQKKGMSTPFDETFSFKKN